MYNKKIREREIKSYLRDARLNRGDREYAVEKLKPYLEHGMTEREFKRELFHLKKDRTDSLSSDELRRVETEINEHYKEE